METLIIKGRFGTLNQSASTSAPETTLMLSPLTVFIGENTKGASEAMRLAYFMQNMKYLLYKGEGVAELATPVPLTKWVLRHVLSGGRDGHSLNGMAENSEIIWRRTGEDGTEGDTRVVAISGRSIRLPKRKWKGEKVEDWMRGWHKEGRIPQDISIFIPAERMMMSFFGPSVFGRLVALPTIKLAVWLDEAAHLLRIWQSDHKAKPEDVKIVEAWSRDVLGGYPVPPSRQYQWMWSWKGISGNFYSMREASSDKQAVWSIIAATQAMFGIDKVERPRYLYIEEPEAYLHPRVQAKLADLIAYAVNRGVRVTVKTHSLPFIYTLNNLLMAKVKFGDEMPTADFPAPQIRLDPAVVSAYEFTSHGVENIFDAEAGQIDEGRLGKTLGQLEAEFNRMVTYGALWG